MKIGIDARPILKKETGVGIYLKNLIWNLWKIDKNNTYYIFSSSLKDRFKRVKVPASDNFHLFDFRLPVSFLNFLWYKIKLPPIDLFFLKKIDIVHSPTPLIIPTLGKCIITVHDLFFFKKPEFTVREMRKIYPQKILDSIRRADGIICPSEFTRSEILRLFYCKDKKIKVIPHGIDESFLKKPERYFVEEVKSKYSLPSEFLLFVGNIEPRKNLNVLIEAFSNLKNKYKELMLVIVGEKILGFKELEEKIEKMGLSDRIIITGYVKNDELSAFYRLSSVFVFPSIEEGFGIPLLEAMASSVPVVASSFSSIPEIVGDAGILFDPYSPDELTEKISMVLDDKELRKELIEKGKERTKNFSWIKSAEATLNFYEEISRL